MQMRDRAHTAEARLERLVQLQGLLAAVARSLGPSLDLDDVLTTVLSAMRGLLAFRGGTIQLVDEAGVRVAAADPPVSADVLAARVPVGTGLSGRVILTGEPVYSPDLDRDPRVDQDLRRAGSNAGMVSYLAVPLVVLGRVTGLLQVDSIEVDAFDADDRMVLEGLATQVAGAIESARTREQIVELEQLKSDFIARVSHELRTPLAIVAGFTDTLLHQELDPERRREVLERVRVANRRLSLLIEELLAVAGLQAGVNRPAPAHHRLAGLLADVRASSIDPLRVHIACPPELEVFADETLLRHATGLLVDNALKYGGLAEVEVDDGDAEVTIVVGDEGPGIAPEDRAHIWERFWRGNHTGAGMGLGLPVVRHLAASLGGRAELLDDGGGPGARFALRLPR